MKKSHFAKTKVSFAATMGFLAGMLTMSAIVAIFPQQREPVMATARSPEPAATPAPTATREPTLSPAPPAIATPQIVAAPEGDVSPLEDLRRRHLELPVQGARGSDVHDMFNEQRGSDRRHEAVDILALRNTRVLAVEDGTVAKLFVSKAGGNTIYQFDPTGRFTYYYAHLEQYANGLKEGQPVARGDVIGYVGTSGNAPPGTPHLHFTIFQLTPDHKWWHGTPINPYLVFSR